MSLSARQLETVLVEIKALLKEGRIHRIDQPQSWAILFQVDLQGKRHRLYFSAHRRHSRFHLVSANPPNPPKPPQFCQLLRAHLRYKRIVSIHQVGGDRIIRIDFSWRTEDESPGVSLTAELMGASANIFLTDAQGIILGSLYPSKDKRALRPGNLYQTPAIHPDASFHETTIPAIENDNLDLKYLFNHSVEAFYRTIEEDEEKEFIKKERLSQLDKAIRKQKKRLRKLWIGHVEAKKAERYRTLGEILKHNLHQIKPGQKILRCVDPAQSEGCEIELELNPALSPSENLGWYFKRYKKGQTAEKTLQSEIVKNQEEIARLEHHLKIVSEGGRIDPTALPHIRPQKNKTQKSGPPSFLSSDGVSIIVGRNDRENDELTFRLARGNDLWFHARGIPGSHLIVRMERRREIPYQTLLDAATLALHFSKGRKAGKGDVLYTFKKYIQRPKNQKAGSVLTSQDKNIYIEIETARLERILQNRIRPV
jgi:predicted ribosome quality control (RQC) complex YloA/Tae2 family protein